VAANSTAVRTNLFAGRRALIAGTSAGVLLLAAFVYLLWPRPAFHITNAQISSKRVGDRVQLFANVFFNNDGGPADFSWSAASGLVRSDAPPAEQMVFVRRLEASAAKPGEAETHPPFAVGSGQDRWFTVYGPVLDRADFRRFVGGSYAFYFAATIVGRSGTGRTALSFCAFNAGRDPIDIHPCPTAP